MKWICISLLLLGLSVATLQAQDDPRLYINNTNVLPDRIQIEYDITYGGFVELHLFDQDGKKVWIKGVVNRKLGSYVFTIPNRKNKDGDKALTAGERYSFFFRYKGEEYSGSFYAG